MSDQPATDLPGTPTLDLTALAEDAPRARREASLREDALRQELTATRAHLEAAIHQLEVSNEELRTAGEDTTAQNARLQDSNEALRETQGQLQESNEALSDANADLLDRNAETRRINDDLTNVLHSVGVAIVLVDLELKIRRFTPEAARLLSLATTDAGRPIFDVKSRLHAPDLVATVREVLQNLVPREDTITDEAGRWYRLGVRPYQTVSGSIAGAVLSIVNMDAVQRSHTLLSEARDYAECIVDTVNVPLVVLEETRRVRSANRAFYEAFSLTRREVEGRRFEELGRPAWGSPLLSAALDQLTLGEAVEDVRLELSASPRGARTIKLSGRPMARALERTRRFLLALEDVTDAMKSEALVRRSEKALRDMLAAASEAIFIVREDGTITFANTTAIRWFGYTAEEFIGLPVEALVPEAVRAAHPAHRAAFRAASADAHVMSEREVSAVRKDGTVFPIQLTLNAMEGDDGPLTVAFLNDITERQEQAARVAKHKQSLQQMAFDAALVEERERRRIAAGLHDNIGQALALAQLRLTTARAAAGANPHPDLDEGLRLVRQAIQDTRSFTFELSPPILYDLGLAAAVSWLGEQLEARHQLQVSLACDDALVALDEEVAALLFRSIRELLVNVVKHAKTKAAAVTLHGDGGDLVVTVRDEGAGFDPTKMRDYETTDGFGLFSVREQIARLGGTFDVTSRPGHGTNVTLRIPFRPRESNLPPRRPR